jgi:FG-GAP repeat protein/type IX secretion system substrate protein
MKRHLTFGIVLVLCFTFLSASEWEQISKIAASDRGANDHFGYSVAISGNFAIVGSYHEDHSTGGTDSLANAGAAYIFTLNEGAWIPLQKIVASDRTENDEFGYSVAISGNYAIVGAWQQDTNATGLDPQREAGAAYIFYYNGSMWAQQQKIVTAEHKPYRYFGLAVSISGNYAIVGSFREDQDANGENSITEAGSAYIFYFNGSVWTQQQKIVASDRASYDQFGWSVAISGDYAVIGAYYESEDANGENTISNAGSAYIFKRSEETWAQQQKIVAPDRDLSDNFGYSVAISGDHVIVGAYTDDEDANGDSTLLTSGSAYIFERAVTSWNLKQKIVALDRSESSWFGYSVAISGNHAIVGAFRELYNTGSAYIFSRNDTSWVQDDKLMAPVRVGYENFGNSVAISGDMALVGIYNDDEDEDEENTLQDAGAAYIFKRSNSDTTNIQDLTVPIGFELLPAYPNPFNPKTVISLHYAENCNSVVNIYDVQGVQVEQLFNGYVEAGIYKLIWNASNMPSGVYIVKMVAENFIGSIKIVLIK